MSHHYLMKRIVGQG